MHPEAVEMEYAQRNISLLHSLDEGCGGLFVVVGGEGCGQPQTKGQNAGGSAGRPVSAVYSFMIFFRDRRGTDNI